MSALNQTKSCAKPHEDPLGPHRRAYAFEHEDREGNPPEPGVEVNHLGRPVIRFDLNRGCGPEPVEQRGEERNHERKMHLLGVSTNASEWRGDRSRYR